VKTVDLDAETQRLLRGFEDATLQAFPHADHVRVAWAYARTLPLADATARMKDGLRRFAAAHGKKTKYHETITWAFMALIHERTRQGQGSASWETFAGTNADVFDRGILHRYYRPETLASPLARAVFVLPDKRG
jgi:hypothetical protein